MMIQSQKVRFFDLKVIALLLVMFIDGVGMSLVLPLMGELFSAGSSSIIGNVVSNWTYQFYYSASLALFSGTMIIGCPLIGQLSDIMGRKRSLQLSLIGTALGYLVCVLAILIKAPVLFLLGRTIDGITAGSIPVAQAMLVDIDNSHNKMTSIGMVMFAVTSGYILGPSISAIIFVTPLLTHALYLPFLFIAFISMLCIFMLIPIMENPSTQKSSSKIDLTISFNQIKNLIQDKTLQLSLLGFFLFQCAWTLYYQYLPQLPRFFSELSASRLSVLIMEIGVGMCISFCVLVPRTQLFFSVRQSLLSCLILFTLLTFSFLVRIENWLQLQLVSIAMSILYAIGYSAALAYLLSLASESKRGLILGSIASLCALSATLTALIGSALTELNYMSFFMAIIAISIMSVILFIISQNKKNLPHLFSVEDEGVKL